MGGSGSFLCRFCSGFGGGFWRAAAGCEKKVDGFCVAGLTAWNDGGDRCMSSSCGQVGLVGGGGVGLVAVV